MILERSTLLDQVAQLIEFRPLQGEVAAVGEEERALPPHQRADDVTDRNLLTAHVDGHLEVEPVPALAHHGDLNLGGSGIAVDRQLAGDSDLDAIDLTQHRKGGLHQRHRITAARNRCRQGRLVHVK